MNSKTVQVNSVLLNLNIFSCLEFIVSKTSRRTAFYISNITSQFFKPVQIYRLNDTKTFYKFQNKLNIS